MRQQRIARGTLVVALVVAIGALAELWRREFKDALALVFIAGMFAASGLLMREAADRRS